MWVPRKQNIKGSEYQIRSTEQVPTIKIILHSTRIQQRHSAWSTIYSRPPSCHYPATNTPYHESNHHRDLDPPYQAVRFQHLGITRPPAHQHHRRYRSQHPGLSFDPHLWPRSTNRRYRSTPGPTENTFTPNRFLGQQHLKNTMLTIFAKFQTTMYILCI